MGRRTERGHDARLVSPDVNRAARGKWAAGANSDMEVVFHTPPGEWPPIHMHAHSHAHSKKKCIFIPVHNQNSTSEDSNKSSSRTAGSGAWMTNTLTCRLGTTKDNMNTAAHELDEAHAGPRPSARLEGSKDETLRNLTEPILKA